MRNDTLEDVVVHKGVVVVSGRRAKPLWLSELQFPFPGNGIVTFEARGTSDIGVFFSSTPERVQEDDQVSAIESSQRAEYEVVIGSYCNKKSVIRKRGVVRAFSTTGVESSVDLAADAAWQSFDHSWTFKKYWIGIRDGVIIAGKGTVGSYAFLKWEDAEPLKGSFQIGVSSWHQPVVFRFFEVFPATESLVPSRADSISFIGNFFSVARNYFSKFFHDVCLESYEGSLFPCHGCVLSLWSKRLKETVDAAIHLNRSYGDRTLRVWNRRKVFFMNFCGWDKQYIPSMKQVYEDIPRIRIGASTCGTAMFVQLLYGVGLDRSQFCSMESDSVTLNLSQHDKQTWQECKALMEEWQVSYFAYMFEEQSDADYGSLVSSNCFNSHPYYLPEGYSEVFVNNFVSYLNYLMDSLFLSDVELVLRVEEQVEISVNNTVVAYSDQLEENRNSCSFSFRAHRGMKEMLQQKIEISCVNVSSFQRMLNSIYKKPIYVMEKPEEDAYLWLDYLDDVKTGDRFDVVNFKREACICLKELVNASNAVHLANLSLECELFDLFQAATDFICSHFEEVFQQTSFTCLREDCFLHILSRIDLEVQHENEVVRAVMKWLEENNPSSLQDLFSMIRHKLVDPPILNSIREKYPSCECLEISSGESTAHATVHNDRKDDDEDPNNDCVYFTNDNDVSEVFEHPGPMTFESFQSVNLEPMKWIPSEFTFQTQQERWKYLKKDWNKMYGNVPRIAPGEVWIPYIPKVHSSGVLYYLGCLYGLQLGGTRVNPLKYDIVKITCSSGNRFARLEGLVESWVSRSCFALPDSSSLVWFALDLGKERLLACSFYTLAHDGSESNFLRNWCLEGSKDGAEWVLLKEHRSDKTLQSPMQKATWRIEDPASQEFYRHFRILARPPCKKMNLGHFEFYGRLRMNPKA